MKIGFLISKEEIEKIKKYVTYFYNVYTRLNFIGVMKSFVLAKTF